MKDSEKDYLVYTGSKVPRVIRFIWTALIVFAIFYIVKFAVPDLKAWLGR